MVMAVLVTVGGMYLCVLLESALMMDWMLWVRCVVECDGCDGVGEVDVCARARQTTKQTLSSGHALGGRTR